VQLEALQAGFTHAWLVHVSPAAQTAHAWPPKPQVAVAFPASQFPELSQQPAQLLGPQVVAWQAPAWHVSLPGQAAQLLPPTPQALGELPGSQLLPEQQPGQLPGPQSVGPWQAPPLHTSPGGQVAHDKPPRPQAAVDPPIWQVPVWSQQPGQLLGPQTGGTWHEPVVQVSPGGQMLQLPPPAPQADVALPGSQLLPLQQPEQFPGPQSVGPWQSPPEQVSAGGQVAQASPPAPHALVVAPFWHVPVASQQPGQLAGPQTGGGIWHMPAEHVSDAGHVAQTPPPNPQALVWLPAMQVLPTQQPGQFEGPQAIADVQMPAEQDSPFGQGRHIAPPLPQAKVWFPPRQALPTQQPGQLPGPHCVGPWHVLPLHVSPGGQDAQAVPPDPQAFVEPPIWQLPLPSQHPAQLAGLQGGGGGWQSPPVHTSPGGQALQAPPPAPQVPTDVPGSQLLPLQQPWQLPGPHDIGPSQTPSEQKSPAGHCAHETPPLPH
jgi:hypothetical protein